MHALKLDRLMARIHDLSEDALERLQNSFHEDSDEFSAIDQELDRRAQIWKASKESQEAIKLVEVENIKLRLVALETIEASTDRGSIMIAVMNEFGSEFIEDYEVSEDFVITSLVSNKFRNKAGPWPCHNHERVQQKLKYLIYDRVYHRYVRENGPTQEYLDRLTAALKELVVS